MKLGINSQKARQERYFFLFLMMGVLFSLATIPVQAQPFTPSFPDSVQSQEQEVEAMTRAILQADSLRRVDSLRQVHLMEELAQLKTTDNLKKAELQAEIEELRNAEIRSRALQKQQIDSLRALSVGAAVILTTDTIFEIHTKLGPFSPQLRADYTRNAIQDIIKERAYEPDSLKLTRSGDAIDLIYKDVVLLTVTTIDALWAETDIDVLAAQYREKVHNAIEQEIAENQIWHITKNILAAIFIILVLFIIIRYVNRGYRKVRVYVLKGRQGWYHGIKIKNYELLSAEKEGRALIIILNFLKWVVILILVYLAMLLLFGIFPWTKPIADMLLGYLINPLRNIALGIWNYLPDLFTVIIILVIFHYLLKALAYFRDEVDREALSIPGFYAEWAKPTYQVVRILLFAFMIVIIYPYLPGSDSPVFQGISVLLGVLLTFGSSSSLSNIISGLVLTYTRAFKLGDRVRIGDSVGVIIEKNLLVTRIRTINNEDITIPNSAVMNSHTINYSADAAEMGLCTSTSIQVSYEVPWRTVHDLLLDAAKRIPGVLQEPSPYVIQKSLGDATVLYEINVYTHEPALLVTILSTLHENIQDNFGEAGISLVIPTVYKSIQNDAETPSDQQPLT